MELRVLIPAGQVAERRRHPSVRRHLRAPRRRRIVAAGLQQLRLHPVEGLRDRAERSDARAQRFQLLPELFLPELQRRHDLVEIAPPFLQTLDRLAGFRLKDAGRRLRVAGEPRRLGGGALDLPGRLDDLRRRLRKAEPGMAIRRQLRDQLRKPRLQPLQAGVDSLRRGGNCRGRVFGARGSARGVSRVLAAFREADQKTPIPPRPPEADPSRRSPPEALPRAPLPPVAETVTRKIRRRAPPWSAFRGPPGDPGAG